MQSNFLTLNFTDENKKMRCRTKIRWRAISLYHQREKTSANGLFLKINEKFRNASLSVHIRQLQSQDAL